MLLLKIVITLSLWTVFWEDLKDRAVHWLLFPLLMIEAVMIRSTANESVWLSLKLSTYNVIFIIVQLLLVTIWFSIKRRKITILTTELLGAGDLLFFLVIAFFLDPLVFIPFYIISLLLIAAGWLLWSLLSLANEKTIPLAGLQAMLLSVVLIAEWCDRLPGRSSLDDLFYQWMI